MTRPATARTRPSPEQGQHRRDERHPYDEGVDGHPDGQAEDLTRGELIDLVRFLSSLGKPGPFAVGPKRLARRWQVFEPSEQDASGPIDPATRVFQALRIAVNGELDRLDRALARLPGWLAPGGRAAIISFHSLEDRRVKNAFRADPALTVLTKKPSTATAGEVQLNARARSAKLRVAERCTSTTHVSPGA